MGRMDGQANILDKVSSCVQRHSELVQHVHQVRYEVAERHREAIPWCDEFAGINHGWVGSIREERCQRQWNT